MNQLDRSLTNDQRPLGSNPDLVAEIAAEIVATGPITFARFMELCLYHPLHGYYRAPLRKPGRGGDFLTAPEASALFGITLARQFAEFWRRLGRPSRWQIAEHGAGIGGLAYDIMTGLHAVEPDALRALNYCLIEINEAARFEAMAAMSEAGLADHVAVFDPAYGLPQVEVGAILANEVADALPVHRLEIVETGFALEAYVDWQDRWFFEILGDISAAAESALETLRLQGAEFPPGSTFEVSPAASAWFQNALQAIDKGFVLVIDYGYPAAERYAGHLLHGSVRTYRSHTVSDDPYLAVGQQDLTAHVDFSALVAAGKEAGFSFAGLTTQGALLDSLGLGVQLLALQADPGTTMPEYYLAQQTVMRLIDPGGMGRFRALMMAKGVPLDPPLLGLTIAPLMF